MGFCEELKQSRIDAGKTLADVAKHLGWKSQSVSDLERGHKAPDPAIIASIASFLDIDPAKLIKLAQSEAKSLKFDLSDMTPKKRELLFFIHSKYDTLNEEDAKAILRLTKNRK